MQNHLPRHFTSAQVQMSPAVTIAVCLNIQSRDFSCLYLHPNEVAVSSKPLAEMCTELPRSIKAL